MSKLGLDSAKEYKLGFVFSFPVQQTAINVAQGIEMAKGWNVPAIKSFEVVKLLKDSLAARQLGNIDPVVVLNDTVGTLLTVPGASIGLILGTGFNIEIIDRGRGEIINTESGNFDGVPFTVYDRKIFENF